MSLADKIAAVVAAIGAELKLKVDAASLSAVATSGDYDDLSNTPTITDGTDGDSAYQIAVDNGFVGDETAWLASLKGADGAPGFTQVTQEQYDALSDKTGIYVVEVDE